MWLPQTISALSGFAWPLLILSAGWYFRSDLRSAFLLIRRQVAGGGAFRWKDFELKGVNIQDFDKRGASYTREIVDQQIFERREIAYKQAKNIFLVHRARATGALHSFNQLMTYDILVYLVSHKNYGRMNDVQEVEYYFGKHFGISEGKYGTKYVVKNGTDGFAVKINGYGPTLCEARIKFHDGAECTLSRYLDFEGCGYQFESATNETDIRKLESRFEEHAPKLTAP